ncbi:MAG: hypothetical protein ACLFNN_02965 [Candidatus Paceibacterota bacterium]
MTKAHLRIMVDEQGNVSSEIDEESYPAISEERLWKLVKQHAESRIRRDLCGVFIQVSSDGTVQKNVLGIEAKNDFLKTSPWLLQLVISSLNEALESGNGKKLKENRRTPFIFSDLLDPEDPAIFPMDDQWTEDY